MFTLYGLESDRINPTRIVINDQLQSRHHNLPWTLDLSFPPRKQDKSWLLQLPRLQQLIALSGLQRCFPNRTSDKPVCLQPESAKEKTSGTTQSNPVMTKLLNLVETLKQQGVIPAQSQLSTSDTTIGANAEMQRVFGTDDPQEINDQVSRYCSCRKCTQWQRH